MTLSFQHYSVKDAERTIKIAENYKINLFKLEWRGANNVGIHGMPLNSLLRIGQQHVDRVDDDKDANGDGLRRNRKR